MVGVTKDLKSKSQIVKLRIDSDQAPYVITKPLHISQEIVKQEDDGSIEITLNVVINLELEREILGFGNNIEVLQPRLLRHRIKKRLMLATRMYENNTDV